MKRALMIATVALVFAAFGLFAGSYAAPSPLIQETFAGDWTAKVKQTERGLVLWLSLNRNSEQRKGRFQSNTNIALQEFSGLNPNANSSVQFSLQREAGTILFDGLFKDGRGVGDFRFTPNAGFAGTMRNFGYDNLPVEKLFVMALHDVGSNYINELKSLGYDKLSLDQLIGLRVMGVTGEFVKEARGWGYGNLSADALLEIKAMGINPEYARAMKALGFDNLSLKKLVELKALGVNEEYVKEMRALGFENLTPNQLIEMKAMGITADYVKKMRAAGLKNVSVNELIEMKATGTDKVLLKEKR